MIALPQGFVDALRAHPEFDGLAAALDTPPEVSVRVNPQKDITVPAGADVVPWYAHGLYLPERPAFTFDPALHQGLYYVQDASSMSIARVAAMLTADGRPVRWLDACAAPGGKSTAVTSALPAGSLVVANEFDRKRANALVENILRWGNPRLMVTTGPTDRFSPLRDFFDVVAVDAPCSGEGMMRKEEVARTQWSAGLVRSCAALQREIISNIWPALRPGGYLIYSTCTFNTAEDEENTLWAMQEFGAESVQLHLSDFPGAIGAVQPYAASVHALRFLPGRVRGEGLYLTVLRKPGDAPAAAVSLPRRFKAVPLSQPWVSGDMVCIADAEGVISAMPADVAAPMLAVRAATNVLVCGTPVAAPKGRDFIPPFGLATSNILNVNAFPHVEVDADDALAFLRGMPLSLPAGTVRGLVLLYYKGRPLGFVKNIGNRANNLLPDSRRIRSAAAAPTTVII